MNVHSKKIDGRSLRAQKTYNEAHEKLVSAAIALYKNPLINKSKITITMIAKDAGVSVATAYNHFPDNKLDILGSIFRLGFEEVSEEYLNFIKKNDDPLVQLNKFLALVGDKIIEYGDAVKYAFFLIFFSVDSICGSQRRKQRRKFSSQFSTYRNTVQSNSIIVMYV